MNKHCMLFVFALALGCFKSNAIAQDSSDKIIIDAKHLITEGLHTADDRLLLEARARLLPLAHDDRLSSLAWYYLGYIDYRLASIHPAMDKDSIVAYLERGIESFQAATAKDNKFAEAYALLASCYGQKIRYYPLAGITLGPKSGSALSTAMALEPENPRIVLLNALSLYFTPALFGGSKEEGLQGFRKAAALFDRWKSPDSLQPDWGYDEAYTWIGFAYLDQHDTLGAKKAFERALEINPKNGWVKYVLLPRADRDLEDKKK